MAAVVDASVAIKWFVEEEGRGAALGVLERILESPSSFAVPELFYFELCHVFNRLVPDPSNTQIFLFDSVLRLPLHRFSMTADLAAEVRELQKRGLSGYDACYLGLAKLIRGTWITADERAHRKVAHLGLSELLSG
jgi:predicted nucleic acid-binding protein